MDKSFGSIAEADRYFAAALHGKTWDLLDKTERTPDEAELMEHTAHASLYHWLQVGTVVHRQRGEWLLGRVYTVLGNVTAAMMHAHQALDLTENHLQEMEEFDLPFALECVARAHALAGDRETALGYLEKARTTGQAIKEDEDRKIFVGELTGGNWYGLT